MQLGLRKSKQDEKQAKESKSVIDKLSSPKVSMAQKRHLMRVVFGDYRKYMREEELRNPSKAP